MLSALSAYHEAGILHIQQLGPGLSLYASSGPLCDPLAAPECAMVDIGSRTTPGDLHCSSVALPAGTPLLAATTLLSATHSPEEVAAALSGAARYSGDVLLQLCFAALERRRHIHTPAAYAIPLTGTAVLVWPSPGA
jgi:hypothetical protein